MSNGHDGAEEQGDFSVFSPWPTKRQPSFLSIRPATSVLSTMRKSWISGRMGGFRPITSGLPCIRLTDGGDTGGNLSTTDAEQRALPGTRYKRPDNGWPGDTKSEERKLEALGMRRRAETAGNRGQRIGKASAARRQHAGHPAQPCTGGTWKRHAQEPVICQSVTVLVPVARWSSGRQSNLGWYRSRTV